MENMVSKVLQVHQGHLVQVQPKGIEVTLGSQASPDPQAGKENQDSQEAADPPAFMVPKENEVTLVSVGALVKKVSPVNLVSMEAGDPRDYKDVLVVRASLDIRCLDRYLTTGHALGNRVFQAQVDPLAPQESLVSLECLDVLVLKVVLVQWVNWVVLDLLGHLDLSVMLDPPVSLDHLENRVFPVQQVVPAFPAASAAVTASATPW